MKRKILLISIIYIMANIVGCVKGVDLDETQQDKLVGYAVYSVLEHDKNYMVGLNDVEELMAEDTTEQPGSDTPTQGNDNKPSTGSDSLVDDKPSVVTTTMEKALDVDGLSIKYTDVVVDDVYPRVEGEPAFALKAFTGNRLVVLQFNVTNTTNSDISLDMASKNLTIKGTFNNSIKTIAQVTLLPEALNTLKETIPAGKTVQAVLVFEMTEANANNLASIVLDIKSSKGTNQVNIK
ncbi:MAG: DUF5067 domain-containing protein [Lachnospiraceae bacterium]|jgi:hypothetical protein|nr:DUF5067 domain-containing protein [Lachnospiraceae bacterium]